MVLSCLFGVLVGFLGYLLEWVRSRGVRIIVKRLFECFFCVRFWVKLVR